jgi:hypothetical protein
MGKVVDDREELRDRIAALEHRLAALERRLATPDLVCPSCGGVLEALALRTNPELHDRAEAWVRCAAWGYAGWGMRGSFCSRVR